jgi:AspT/YidE/YbjL antiporter-like protein
MIGELLRSQPEIALFASLALGYFIGSFKVGPIQLGGVCGTLIVALLLGQTGARIAPDLKNIAFALFIFALGFTGGPQFFANIGRGWRYGLLSVVEIVSVTALIMIAVALLGLDRGTASGLLAGAATESAVIGTASEAIAKLGLSDAETVRLRLIRNRKKALFEEIAISFPDDDENQVDYYTILDLEFLGKRAFGQEFVDWLFKNTEPSELLFRLAREARVVLLPGLGFGTQHPSGRVSLANLNESDYRKIGKAMRKLIEEYVEKFNAATGKKLDKDKVK